LKWVASLSTRPRYEDAFQEAASSVARQLEGHQPDLVLVFLSAHFEDSYQRIPLDVKSHFRGAVLLGCSGGGIIGQGQEIEDRPALSMTAAVLPDVAIVPFHIPPGELPDVDNAHQAWSDRIGLSPDHEPAFIVLPDPFSSDAQQLAWGLDAAYPNSTVVGGLASGARAPGENALFIGQRTYSSGVVGIAVYGDIKVETVVAQGCRPLGEPMRITRCERNLLFELDGGPVIEALDGVFSNLNAADQRTFQMSPMLGIAMDSDRTSYGPGDFLIRNLVGLDRSRGVLAVAAMLDPKAIVQFHIRDAAASAHDLAGVLTRHRMGEDGHQPAGALLFSCLGRGRQFYGTPDHDTQLFREYFGDIALGGFFCSGEIGPVHGRTYLHGYTSSFGLFSPRGWS
jgi:small ligand-binding sensory domain FIST